MTGIAGFSALRQMKTGMDSTWKIIRRNPLRYMHRKRPKNARKNLKLKSSKITREKTSKAYLGNKSKHLSWAVFWLVMVSALSCALISSTVFIIVLAVFVPITIFYVIFQIFCLGITKKTIGRKRDFSDVKLESRSLKRSLPRLHVRPLKVSSRIKIKKLV